MVTHGNDCVYCRIGNYQGMQQQQPRNLPPDGTTFNQISLGKRLKQVLPPYGYWNMQFYQVSLLFANFAIKKYRIILRIFQTQPNKPDNK